MQFSEVMKKCVQKTVTAIRLPFRGTLTQLQTKTPLQLVQGEGLAEEQLQSVELLQQFGFTSGVPVGSQLIVLPIGGKTVHTVVIATEHSSFRIQVEPGETAIYNQWGAKIVLQKEKIVAIDCEHLRINATKGMHIQTEQYTLESTTCLLKASNATTIQTPQLAVASDGDSSTDAQIKAQVQLEGNLTSSGTIVSDGDQVAAGISQAQHRHGGVETGGGNTSPPV